MCLQQHCLPYVYSGPRRRRRHRVVSTAERPIALDTDNVRLRLLFFGFVHKESLVSPRGARRSFPDPNRSSPHSPHSLGDAFSGGFWAASELDYIPPIDGSPYCKCDNGWSGTLPLLLRFALGARVPLTHAFAVGSADFLDTSSSDCGVNRYAIVALWIVNMLLVFYVLFKSLVVIEYRVTNFNMQRKTRPDYTLWKNKGLMATMCLFLGTIPCMLTYSVLKFAVPSARVGFNLPLTIVFLVGKVTFYTGVMFYSPSLLATALKSEKSQFMKRVVRFNYMFTGFVQCVSITAGILPFITYARGPPSPTNAENTLDDQLVVLKAYYYSQGAGLGMFGISSLYVNYVIQKQLARAVSLSSDGGGRVQKIRKKIRDVMMTGVKQAVVQSAIVFSMTTHFLLNKHDYFLPISWLAMAVLAKNVAFAVELDAKTSKGTLARLGIKRGGTGGSTMRTGTATGTAASAQSATDPGTVGHKTFAMVAGAIEPVGSYYGGNENEERIRGDAGSKGSAILEETVASTTHD